MSRKIILFAILLCFFFSSSIVFCEDDPSAQEIHSALTVQGPISFEFENFTNYYRRCLFENLQGKEKIWRWMPTVIESCLSKKFWKALNARRIKLPINHDHIMFIGPKSTISPCVAVRADYVMDRGIGLLPENSLRRLVPHCKFFGASQMDSVNFRSIGRFFRKVISFMEPPQETWPNEDPTKGPYNVAAYIREYPLYVKLKTFLEQYVKKSRVDYLWIDPSGGLTLAGSDNYIVPSTFYFGYSIFSEPTNVTVCQVMIGTRLFQEIKQGDMMERARPHFKPLIESILIRSSFLPIYAEVSRQYGKIYQLYVNISDPYCVKKYLADAFCKMEGCQAEDIAS